MSDAGSAVKDGLIDAIADVAELAEVPLYTAAVPAGVLPRIEVAEPIGADWSAKDWRGRELRTAVTIRLATGQADRLGAMRAAAEAAGETIAGVLDGWRVASAVLLRSRMIEERGGVLAVLVEHRVRVTEA